MTKTSEYEIRFTELQDPENPDWAKLDDYLWETHWDPNFRKDIRSRAWSVRLSAADWETIKKIVRKQGLPVTLCNTDFGFTVGVQIWQPAEWSWSTMVERPRPLVTISAHHLPECPRGSSFDYGWDEFTPITHSEENLALLDANELERPRDRFYYVY
jgi:predicted DNA binding CopG/RHH family protein